jgi:hypothetical protein
MPAFGPDMTYYSDLIEISSYGAVDGDVDILSCDAVWASKKMPTFRRNILSLSSGDNMFLQNVSFRL